METSDLTARQIYQQIKDNPSRARFGFGKKAILINVDPQKAYTRTDLFKTAYETDPKQLDYVNQLATAFRALDWPVVWTYVAFMASGEDPALEDQVNKHQRHIKDLSSTLEDHTAYTTKQFWYTQQQLNSMSDSGKGKKRGGSRLRSAAKALIKHKKGKSASDVTAGASAVSGQQGCDLRVHSCHLQQHYMGGRQGQSQCDPDETGDQGFRKDEKVHRGAGRRLSVRCDLDKRGESEEQSPLGLRAQGLGLGTTSMKEVRTMRKSMTLVELRRYACGESTNLLSGCFRLCQSSPPESN